MTRIGKIRARCKAALEKSLPRAGCLIAAREDAPWLIAKLDTLADLLRDLPKCTCDPAFSERGRIDPQCSRCGCFPDEEELRRALEGLDK